jgi:hypothetical protein
MNPRKFPPPFLPLSILFLLFSAVSSGFAQATSGGLSGFVRDPAGAAVPSAQVTITDLDRGAVYTVVTTSDGQYSRSQLPNGRYNVQITAKGFKTALQKDIIVDIDRDTRMNVTLQPGEVQESVTVEANEAPVLNADRPEISTTITASQLNQLPMLSQNVTTLELLSPGTVHNNYSIAAQENPQGGQANNTNGLLFGFTNRQIDGADDMDAVLGIQVVNPPPDSLDQMKVTTSNYDAEFGRAAGSFVQYATKSGTNSFHGDAFEFLRNNYFDARNPYTESSVNHQPQQPLRFNLFGGSFGGKVIPNKLFIFGTYQGQRQRIGSAFVTSVPTAAERAGDLTGIGGPILPAGAISPVASNLLALIPQPNAGVVGGVGRFIGGGSVKFDTDQYDARLDWIIGGKDRLFFRYDGFFSTINTPAVFGPIAGGPSVFPAFGPGSSRGRNQSGTANLNHVFSPTLLLNLRASYLRYQIDVLPTDFGSNTAAAVGIPGVNLGTKDTSGLSNFIFNGTALSGATVPGFPSSSFQFGTTINTNAPLHELEQIYQLSTAVTKQMSNHELKFGGDYRWIANFRNASDFSQRGVFQFNSDVATPFGVTTDAFESFLLGFPSSFQRFVFVGNPKEYEQDVFAFAQDRWRMSPKLTLSLGLRYEVYTAPYANRFNGSNFNLTTGQLMVANVGSVDRYTNINTRLNNFAPRVGFAYNVLPNTVVRAGYGRSFFPNFFSIQISQNYPVNNPQNIAAPAGLPLGFTLSQGPPFPPAPVIPPSGLLPLPATVSAKGSIPINRKTGYVDMYNLTVQQQFGRDFSLQLAYVGNQARHLYDFFAANAPIPGPGNSNFNRPYFPQFGYTQEIQAFANDLSSNYNSFQATVDKRLSKYFSLVGQYTWSKTLNYGDNSREYGPYNLRSQYGPAGFDRTHAFSIGHVAEVPIGPGKPFFKNMNPIVRQIAAGWQWTGVTTVYSGRPYTPIYGTNVSLNSNFTLRAFQTGDPRVNIPSGLGFNPGAYVPINQIVANGVVNPAFAFMEGNAGRNSLRGPNFFEADWELGKNFYITERQVLHFAWQNFNALNNVNRGLPINDLTSSSAGQFTGLEVFAIPRTMQFSLRYSF